MSEFVVYGVPGSPYLRAVLLGLEEKRAPWRLAGMVRGDQKSPEHLARHPFGRIPAFEHEDFHLYETQAILRYLDRILPTPSLTPGDARSEARMNQLVGITDWYVMPNISAAISWHRVVAPRFGLPVDEAKIAAAVPVAEGCIAEIARLLGGKEFLTGNAVSIADLMLAPQLDLFAATPEGASMLTAHPGLRSWLDHMTARPSMVATTWQALTSRVASAEPGRAAAD